MRDTITGLSRSHFVAAGRNHSAAHQNRDWGEAKIRASPEEQHADTVTKRGETLLTFGTATQGGSIMSDQADGSHEEPFSRLPAEARAALGDCLYLNSRFLGGAHQPDFTGFGHLQFETDDSIQQVRSYYRSRIVPERPVAEGSWYRMSGEKPWFVLRSAYETGGSWMGMHVTDTRSLSIFAATEEQEGNVKLLLTWEDRPG
jgi:hypothetical protein